MEKNNMRIVIAILLIVAGITLGTVTFVHAVYFAPQKEVAIPESPLFLATSTIPVRINIPSINLDAKVEEVGITYAGNMSTPKFLNDTGWYKYGTLPGENGSAVIDGHVNNGLDLAGVFVNLKNVQIGDDIDITTQNNTVLHFSVTDVERYYYTDLPLTTIFNRTGGAYLNLITCDGTWIPDAKTDDHRIVVYAKLVS